MTYQLQQQLGQTDLTSLLFGAAAGGTQSKWCSDINVQGSCKPLAGICKPMDNATLAAFMALQSQLNRLAKVRGLSLVDVDGRLGPKTVQLYNTVTGSSLSRCDALAPLAIAGSAVSQVQSMADAAGAPASVAPPLTSRPSKPGAGGLPPSDPPGLAITDFVTSPIGLVAVAGLGFVAWKMSKGKKGGSARHRPRRSVRRARRRRR